MDFKLIILEEAEKEWDNSISWYNEKDESLGYEVYEEIRKNILTLKENPFIYQKRYGDLRVLFTKRFRFGIYFFVENNQIIITAILNSKENQNKIFNRLKTK